jgi:uncharacterized protein (DUF58 family)
VPTRRGWLLAGAGLVLLVSGRVLGLPELYVLGTTAVVLTAIATITVRATRMRLDASRTIEPAQVGLGAASVAQLTVRNRGWGRSPVVLLRDPVGRSGAEGRFLLTPLAPGQGESVTYLLPTDRRGRLRVGPVLAEVSDPFFLAARTIDLGEAASLTVFPAVEELLSLSSTSFGPREGATRPVASPTSGDEFFALRAYAEGDDLRRVHWPSTARLDRLVVRQDESEWGGRTSVLVDMRRSVHSAESLETALSAAASVASASSSSLLRVVGTDGRDSGFGRGPAHTRGILGQLAESQATSAGDLVSSIARVCRRGDGGGLVVITASTSSDRDIKRIAATRARFHPLVLVLVSDGHDTSPGRSARSVPDGLTVVQALIGSPMAGPWRAALTGRRPRRAGFASPSDMP